MGLAHTGLGLQRLGHLPQLDPMPSDLDLVIHAPQELDPAIMALSNLIARSVETLPRPIGARG